MRTFIALELPPDFADDTAAVARRLAASLEGRFLDRATYHLTPALPLPAEARSATLFKSTLSREGATYKSLYTRLLESRPRFTLQAETTPNSAINIYHSLSRLDHIRNWCLHVNSTEGQSSKAHFSLALFLQHDEHLVLF